MNIRTLTASILVLGTLTSGAFAGVYLVQPSP